MQQVILQPAVWGLRFCSLQNRGKYAYAETTQKSACNSLRACGIILLAIAAGDDIRAGAATEIGLSCIYAYTIKEVRQMSRKCEICGKGQVSGNNVSHSNRHTRRKWNANIQTVRINDNGTVRRANVCTRCIRSGKINRAI